MRLFIAVTNDRYELPVAVADSCEELARLMSVKPQRMYEYTNYYSKPRKTRYKRAKHKYRYFRLEVEE